MGPSRGGPGHCRSYSPLRTVVLPVVRLDDRIGHLSRDLVQWGVRERVWTRILGQVDGDRWNPSGHVVSQSRVVLRGSPPPSGRLPLVTSRSAVFTGLSGDDATASSRASQTSTT